MLTDEMTWNDRFVFHTTIYNSVREDNGLTTIWSCYNVEEDVTDFSEVPYPDMQVLEYAGVEVKVAPNATWLDLWKYAEILYHAKIGKLGTGHEYVFVEHFVDKGNGRYHLWTGS